MVSLTDEQKKNLIALAVAVETSSSFNMRSFTWGEAGLRSTDDHPCGTPACVLGHAEQIHGGLTMARVKDIFGLTSEQQHALFYPMYSKGQPVDYVVDNPSGIEAGATIRRFIETGEMRW